MEQSNEKELIKQLAEQCCDEIYEKVVNAIDVSSKDKNWHSLTREEKLDMVKGFVKIGGD